jgi:hypothetical protein
MLLLSLLFLFLNNVIRSPLLGATSNKGRSLSPLVDLARGGALVRGFCASPPHCPLGGSHHTEYKERMMDK